MFKQDLKAIPVRDFVFPVGVLKDGLLELAGTAFFVGGHGVAVTAAHVVKDIHSGGDPIGVFTDGQQWHIIPVIEAETHSSEDAALLKMQGDWHSIIEIATASEQASCEYELWGYPERVAHEPRKSATTLEDAATLVLPELIYNRGYVRRRISRQLPVSVFRGEAFYELSEVGGACCSGSPVIKRQGGNGPWHAFAIYIGEETGEAVSAVGLATRCDALATWRSKMFSGGLEDLRATVP